MGVMGILCTLTIIFSLFGTVFLISPSYAGTASFGASENKQLPGQVDDFNADIVSGERFWIIPNHVISLDTSAGPWKKNLLPVEDESVPVDDSTTQGTPQTFFDIDETITVGPNGESFTEWHEEIVTPGWIWEYSDFSAKPPDSNSFLEKVKVTGDETNSLTICFENPLLPGTEFLIEKTLVFVGTNDGLLNSKQTETSSFSDLNPLVVLQYPTDIHCEGEPVDVLVCHKGKKTKSISEDEVPKHIAHGDELGECPPKAPKPTPEEKALEKANKAQDKADNASPKKQDKEQAKACKKIQKEISKLEKKGITVPDELQDLFNDNCIHP